jgi:hypothetical protein
MTSGATVLPTQSPTETNHVEHMLAGVAVEVRSHITGGPV